MIKKNLKWEQNKPSKIFIHIHKTDVIFFIIKYIKKAILIEGRTNAMILNKAKNISDIINQTLTC